MVDDEPDLRFLSRRIFTCAGHEVTEAGDGEMALAAVLLSRPDLVVTDIMMPVMDGVRLIHALRADPATTTIPILVVSGDWQLAVGADTTLAKPCPRATLLAAAERLLREGRVVP